MHGGAKGGLDGRLLLLAPVSVGAFVGVVG